MQQWGCYFLCLYCYIKIFKKIRFNNKYINTNYY
ncbi:DUF261 family protein [Borrelia turicatae]